jgi:undecaprenyl-diphosphatase
MSSDRWQDFFYFFGRYGIVLFFLSFIYLILKKKIRAFLCILLAMGVAGTVDFLIFMFWQRPRPFITHSDMVSNIYSTSASLSSFPSSHTYIAFAIATSIFLYGHKRLGSILFVLAILVAVGRIGLGLHYPSDVIGGILLGILSGVAVFFMVKNWERRDPEA